MKSFRKMVLKRDSAPKRGTRRRHKDDVTPVMDGLRDDIPSEVIDVTRVPVPPKSSTDTEFSPFETR